jgi:predicted amino acid-binding ACT domain protein/phosphoserine phosphatase
VIVGFFEIEKDIYLINAMGEDRAGLIAMLTKVVANAGFNIIDIEQSAPHGLFYIIMIIEPTQQAIISPLKYFQERFGELSAGTDLNISIKPFKGGIRKSSKSWLSFVFVGPDRPGLIASFSDYAGKNNANIHRLNMISRGQIIACESLLDLSGVKITRDQFILSLKNLGEELGLQIIVESEDVFQKKTSKLLVLDLDDNLIQVQGLSGFIEAISLTESDKKLLKDIRSGSNPQDIKRSCLKFLEGMDLSTIKTIIDSIIISPGTEEIIRALQLMQYTIALLSNSLMFFTDVLKSRLNLEYAFGNMVEIQNEKLTGSYESKLEINGEKKERLVEWLATMEKVPQAEVIQFGFDSEGKDPILSQIPGFKICISYDFEVFKDLISRNVCNSIQILSLLIAIGMENSQLKKIFSIVNGPNV